MLTITDLAAVNAAFASKTPRPLRDIMLEIYPDATEDCNGRFHAPHDGYLCPITEQEFRAGEFLPMEEPEDGYRNMGSSTVYPEGMDLSGAKYRWQGTRAQNAAAWGELIAQSRAYDAIRSDHVGTVGAMLKLDLTIEHIHVICGFYGNINIHIMKDASGNVVIYKKSNGPLVKGRRMGRDIYVVKGDTIRLKGKVKEHGVREGVKQTIIERPKVV